MATGRLRWMDLVRGLCILVVVTMHASSALSERAGIASPPVIQAFNDALGPFRMTLLMFLSGMLLGRSLDKPTGVYIKGKLAQIYWPFLIWSMVVLYAVDLFTVEYILKTPISAPTLLWYLWFLCAYYLIALGMRRFSIPLVPVALIALAASTVLPDFLRMSRFAYLFFFFLSGHWYMQHRDRFVVGAPLAWAGLAAAGAGAWMSVQGVIVRYEAVYAWVPLGLILWTVWIGARYQGGSALARLIEWVGRNSLVFYVAHFPVQCAVVDALTGRGMTGFYPVYITALLASLFVAIVLQWLRERSNLVAGLFDFRKLQAFVHPGQRPQESS